MVEKNPVVLGNYHKDFSSLPQLSDCWSPVANAKGSVTKQTGNQFCICNLQQNEATNEVKSKGMTKFYGP